MQGTKEPFICNDDTGNKFTFTNSIAPTAVNGNRCLLNAFFGAILQMKNEDLTMTKGQHFSLLRYSDDGQLEIVKRYLFNNDDQKFNHFQHLPRDDIEQLCCSKG